MAYVRRIISEEHRGELVVRRYEVETPRWEFEFDFVDLASFGKLFELELRLSTRMAAYFRAVPYLLGEQIVRHGFTPACNLPFCCCDWDILYYPEEPHVRAITAMKTYRGGPVILAVVAEDEFARLYGSEIWPTPEWNW